MSIKNIKDELFKLLSFEKENAYSSKDLEEKICHNTKYDIYNQYYILLHNNTSYSFVFDMKKQVLKQVKELEEKYDQLLKQYDSEEDNDKKNKMVSTINECVYRIDSLNNVFNVINRNLKENNHNIISFSDKAINLIEKINKETNPIQKNQLEELLFRINEERRAVLTSEGGSYIIKEISELESLELRIANASENTPIYRLNRKEYLNALKDTIHAINEFYFLDFKKSKHYQVNNDLSKEENEALFHKRLDLYINKYYSLISSLFNDNYYIIEKGNSKISTDDLINYLSIYNLDGNYEIFRSKNKNTLIGNNEINKVDYQNKIEFLNGIVNTLIEKCANRINNKYIDIIDLRSDKEELINLRNIKIGEIDVLIEGEKLNARR